MKLKKFLCVAIPAVTALFPWHPAMGQDGGFDLTSQRGEIQEYRNVDGKKINHNGLIINPTPQSVERPLTGVLNASGGFSVKDKQKAFANDLDFLRQAPKGLQLTIDFGPKVARKAGVKDISGAYVLNIGAKDVKITGYDESGAYYGLQTLRQILSSPVSKGGDELPMMVINDYPSLKYRGIVEGFYGNPWSHKVRMGLIEFLGNNKMNDYIYGPKDDPFHSSPNWRQPYPENEARQIKELVEQSKKHRVNFVWAIHPGADIRWNDADYDSLVNKFNMMYDLGVRSFAIFFDDISGEGTNPKKQVELLNRLTTEFVKAKGDVTNLQICPTDYSQLWAKKGEDGPLAVYGRELNPDVEVYWTGAVVCSDLTPETLEFVDSRIKRPALYWWNYPVTDYCRHILLQGPVYGLDQSLSRDQVIGIESNPMEHGEASKLALYGVADYGWNTSAYNPLDNWERGLVDRMPDAPEAYRTFAIHSADTETGYRRAESWETQIFPFNQYTQEQFEALKAEFEKVVGTEKEIREKGDAALVAELSPWLVEFTALGKRGLSTLDLIKTYEAGNDSIFWEAYVANMMTPEQKKDYEAHKIGTMKLQPFYENAMNDMATAYMERLSGKTPALYRGIGSFPNLRTTQANLMLDGDTATFYTSANSQQSGSWIGLDLLSIKPVDEVVVYQGRNSVDDVDYFERVVLESSVDGRTWKALTDSLEKTYEIVWKGTPVEARYLRLRRLDSEKSNWASVREFMVNPVSGERLGFEIVEAQPQTGKLLAFDMNPYTAYTLDGTLAFERPSSAKEMVLLGSNLSVAVSVKQLDAKGKVVAETSTCSPYSKVVFVPEATKIEITGHMGINELILK